MAALMIFLHILLVVIALFITDRSHGKAKLIPTARYRSLAEDSCSVQTDHT